jgi:amylosucrase
MVMLWSSLAAGDAALATQAMMSLPSTPRSASWVNYVRCHDDIGWSVSDADADAVGLSGPAHRRFLAEFYRGDFAGSFATGAAFSSNPAADDERTCGSAAALCGVGAALESGRSDFVDHALRRLELLYGVMYGFGGIPLVYMGDELALADDSRWMHRPWMPWDVAARRNVPGSVEHRMFQFLQRLGEVRRTTAALAAGGETWIHRLPDTALFGWARRHPLFGSFYGLANFSVRRAVAARTALDWAGLERPRLLLSNGEVAYRGDVHLGPHSFVWFVDDVDGPLQPAG